MSSFLTIILFWIGPSAGQATAGFGPSELNRLLDQNPRTLRPTRTVAELVPLLPDDFRRNFTLVFDSRSPFRSSISPEYPRVILFGSDARLTITFTGDPRKSGFNSIEWLSFDDQTARFTAGARVLPAALTAHPTFRIDTSRCVSCHGTDVRPINDSYPAWPGFYGAVHDSFPTQNRSTTEEMRHYRNFISNAAQDTSSVYAKLILPPGSSVTPYLEPKSVDPTRPELDRDLIALMPNTKFGVALTELNRKRIFRKLSASARFEGMKYEYLHELLDCGISHVDSARIDRIARAVELENAARLKRLDPQHRDAQIKMADMEEIHFTRSLAQLDWIAEDSGIGRKDWSMALAENSLAFFDGILSGRLADRDFYIKEDMILELLSHLSERDQTWGKFVKIRRGFDPKLNIGTRLDLTRAIGACERIRPLVAKSIEDAHRVRLALIRGGRMPTKFSIIGNAATSEHETCRLLNGRRWASFAACGALPVCRIDDFTADEVDCSPVRSPSSIKP